MDFCLFACLFNLGYYVTLAACIRLYWIKQSSLTPVVMNAISLRKSKACLKMSKALLSVIFSHSKCQQKLFDSCTVVKLTYV